jgi:hypothetical protein
MFTLLFSEDIDHVHIAFFSARIYDHVHIAFFLERIYDRVHITFF